MKKIGYLGWIVVGGAVVALGTAGTIIGNAIYREKRIRPLYRRLIQLVDRDGDGKVGFEEKVEAFRRMGYTRTFVEGDEFPEPTAAELERAISTYQK